MRATAKINTAADFNPVPADPEDDFVPRLAHCHPSHRWTRREDDSVELWCACGATPGREVLPMFSSRFPCPVHDPAHARMWSTGVTRRDVFSDLAKVLLGATLDLECKAQLTERERCEWVGVEYLEPRCWCPFLSRARDYLDCCVASGTEADDLSMERLDRDRAEESSRIVHQLVAHREWGQRIKASALGVRPTLAEIDAYRHNVSRINVPRGRSGYDYVNTLIDEYHQHGGIVRHFGFGQDPHK